MITQYRNQDGVSAIIVHLLFGTLCPKIIAQYCHYKRPARWVVTQILCNQIMNNFPRYFVSKDHCKARKGKTLRMEKSIDLRVVVSVVVEVSVVSVVEGFAAGEFTNINLLRVKCPPF